MKERKKRGNDRDPDDKVVWISNQRKALFIIHGKNSQISRLFFLGEPGIGRKSK
jgi:hypothetical protein